MSNNILITGGAGYIGSHTVKLLHARGESFVVLDNLSTGFRESVVAGKFIEGNVGDEKLVSDILSDFSIDTVIHFAAHTIVPESVADPLKYYSNNTCSTLNLLRCCNIAGVKNFVFSSTAAVYGEPDSGLIKESAPKNPINPYGTSKLMSEWMLADLCRASSMKHVILRYFNVAGSDPEGEIGQSTRKATLLTKVACEVAVGKRDKLYIFGTDYPTSDGTGVRDYIHVTDLASAHLAALDYLRVGGDSAILNCGYGRGFSVREVITAVEKAHGQPLPVIETARRSGDPAELVSDVTAIHQVLNWKPEYDSLDIIARTSLAWERKLAQSD